MQSFPELATASQNHRAGLLRLAILAFGKEWKRLALSPSLSISVKLFLKKAEIPDDTLGDDIARATLSHLLFDGVRQPSNALDSKFPRDETAFNAALASVRAALGSALAQTRSLVLAILHDTAQLEHALELQPLPAAIHDDLLDQLAWLVYPGFTTLTPFDALQHFPRYLEAARLRVERARLNPAADLKRLTAELLPLWTQYKNLLATRRDRPEAYPTNPAALAEYRWMLEEFRVSLFAQQLKTAYPASAKRLAALWQLAVT